MIFQLFRTRPGCAPPPSCARGHSLLERSGLRKRLPARHGGRGADAASALRGLTLPALWGTKGEGAMSSCEFEGCGRG
jgi:hypothetical protein